VTTHKGHPTKIDGRLSTRWAIASLNSVGGGEVVGGTVSLFDLVNTQTIRAHRLKVISGGWTVGLPISGAVSPSNYTNFTTRRPVNFADFNGNWAEIQSKSFVYYSVTDLRIRDGGLVAPALAKMKIKGSGWTSVGVSTEGGRTEVLYTADGRPVDSGFESYPDLADLPAVEDLEGVKIVKNVDSLVVRLDGDSLFDFDKADLKPTATYNLNVVGSLIQLNPIRGLSIDGHTDAIGGDEYNRRLSKQRADAVAAYLRKHGSLKPGIPIETNGLGKSQPIAPNTKPSGSDDPAGRAKNRRVEIFVIKL